MSLIQTQIRGRGLIGQVPCCLLVPPDIYLKKHVALTLTGSIVLEQPAKESSLHPKPEQMFSLASMSELKLS